MTQARGFTLIELLVVVSIIGLLSSVVLVSVSSARMRAQIGRMQEDFHSIQNAVSVAEVNGQVLLQITGNGCTACSFNSSSKMDTQTGAIGGNNTTWSRIGGYTTAPIDPWGQPYTIDENEHEFSGTDCRFDTINSAGLDGILGTSDDYSAHLRPVICP